MTREEPPDDVVEAWDRECARLLQENAKISLYEYFAPSLDSVGAPPTYFLNWTRQKAERGSIKALAWLCLGTLGCLVRLSTVYLVTRGLRTKTRRELAAARWLQIVFDAAADRRKDVGATAGGLVSDLNPSFFRPRNLILLRRTDCGNRVISCVALLGLMDFVRALYRGVRIAATDRTLRTGRRPVERSVFGLLKSTAICAAMTTFSDVTVILYWENRGYENRVASAFPQRTIFLTIGVEGRAGPIYLNHRTHFFHCPAFSNSVWQVDLIADRFAPGKLAAQSLVHHSLDLRPTAVDRELQCGAQAVTDAPARVLIVQTYDDFPTSSEVIADATKFDFEILYHPEFSGRRDRSARLQDVLSSPSPQGLLFVYSGCSSLPYELLASGYAVVHVETPQKANFLAEFSTHSYPDLAGIFDLVDRDRSFARDEARRLRIAWNERMRFNGWQDDAVLIHETLEAMLGARAS